MGYLNFFKFFLVFIAQAKKKPLDTVIKPAFQTFYSESAKLSEGGSCVLLLLPRGCSDPFSCLMLQSKRGWSDKRSI
jgi:hypothetical protein